MGVRIRNIPASPGGVAHVTPGNSERQLGAILRFRCNRDDTNARSPSWRSRRRDQVQGSRVYLRRGTASSMVRLCSCMLPRILRRLRHAPQALSTPLQSSTSTNREGSGSRLAEWREGLEGASMLQNGHRGLHLYPKNTPWCPRCFPRVQGALGVDGSACSAKVSIAQIPLPETKEETQSFV